MKTDLFLYLIIFRLHSFVRARLPCRTEKHRFLTLSRVELSTGVTLSVLSKVDIVTAVEFYLDIVRVIRYACNVSNIVPRE